LANLEALALKAAAVITFLLLVAGVIALFKAGYQKIIEKDPTSASAALSFGFLLIVMLTISQFKHVKGFGFEAETWDQKQVEAAKLIDQLQALAEATSRELAMVAASVGRWDNGPPNEDLIGMINTLGPILEKSGFDKNRRDTVFAPIFDRVLFNYRVQAYSKVYDAFKRQYNVTDSNPCHSSQELSPPATEYRRELCDLVGRIYSPNVSVMPDIKAIISIAQKGPLDHKEILVQQLVVDDADFEFFKTKRELRPARAQ
jgi:hypothetical protein